MRGGRFSLADIGPAMLGAAKDQNTPRGVARWFTCIRDLSDIKSEQEVRPCNRQ